MGSVFSTQNKTNELEEQPVTPRREEEAGVGTPVKQQSTVRDSPSFWRFLDPRSPTEFIKRTPLRDIIFGVQKAAQPKTNATEITNTPTKTEAPVVLSFTDSPNASPVPKLNSSLFADVDPKPLLKSSKNVRASKRIRASPLRPSPARKVDVKQFDERENIIFSDETITRKSSSKPLLPKGKSISTPSKLPPTGTPTRNRGVLLDISNANY
ncbi:hypothetical protein AKO1_000329 [Acrasis kona]|uniref:Uncharacterized protein n=1 Tax=Acrasis kona TaxID=1008807 RepID=A0AAW2ZFS6_9EUKA